MYLCERNVLEFVKKLPDDVIKKIYEDYIRIQYLTDVFLNIELKTYDSVRLRPKNLYNRYIIMKNIPKLIFHVRISHEVFNRIYFEHYIKQKKSFVRMDFDESFILSLLFTLYH